jgi:hypothetical protein
MRLRLFPVVTLLLAAGCATSTPVAPKPKASTAPATAAPVVAATQAVPSLAPAAAAVYTGQVTAPVGIVAQGAGNVIGGNASSIVAQGAGNYGLLATTEQPLAGAQVFLADAGGKLAAGTQAGTTDAQGRYKLTAPKAGRYLVIVVGANGAGKPVALQAVAFQPGADVAVTGASTCVAATLLAGQAGDVGALDATAFASAVAVVAGKLTDANHPDWSDAAAIATFTNGIAELKDLLAGLRSQLNQIQQDLDTLKDQVGQLLKPSPTPTPTPFMIVPDAGGVARAHVMLVGKLKAKDDRPGKIELALRPVNSDEKADNGITYLNNKDTKPTLLGTVGEVVTFDLGTVSLPCKFFLHAVRGDKLESYDAIKDQDPDEQQEYKLDVHDGQITVTVNDKSGQAFLLKDVSAPASP